MPSNKGGMLKLSIHFALGTLLSRVTGLLRDIIMNASLGSKVMEVYLVAFRIPNLLRDLLAEGALSSSFVKVYSAESKTNAYLARCFLFRIWILTLALGLFVTLIGMFMAPLWVGLFSISLNKTLRDQSFLTQVVSMTQLLFPFIAIAMINALLSGLLQQQKKFLHAAVAPLFYNLAIVFSLLLLSLNLYPSFSQSPLTVLGFATLIGGIVQGFYLFKCSKLSKLVRGLRCSWSQTNPQLKKTTRLMLPMILATSATQINLVINTNFAMSLATGTATWLTNAFRLVHLPIGLFGVGIGSVLLPKLTEILVTERLEKTSSHASINLVNQALSMLLWFVFPCMFLLLMEAQNIVQILFGHGKYTTYDVYATARILQGYSLGLFGYASLKVLISVYYALDRTKHAMWISLFGIFVNFFANYFLIVYYNHVGMAIAAAVVWNLHALLLLWGIKSFWKELTWKKLLQQIVLLSSVSLFLFILRRVSYDPFFALFDHKSIWIRLLWLALECSIIITSYLISASWYWSFKKEKMRSTLQKFLRSRYT